MIPTISFDVDDVLADFHGKFRRLAHRMYPHYMPLPESDTWDQPNWPLTPQERTMLSMVWKSEPDFYANLELLPEVDVEWLQALTRQCHVIFVSSRHACPAGRAAYAQTFDWLRERVGIAFPTVVITDHKGAVLEAARALVHVDDSLHGMNAIRCHYLALELRPPTLLLAPHCQNKTVDWRVPDWATLKRKIEEALEGARRGKAVFADRR